MNNTKRLASIDTLLQGVPQFQCVEGCSDCCGPVPMTRLEMSRIKARVGEYEMFDKDLHCGLLKDGKCSVYDIRPAICRVFGATSFQPRLVCPHGRKPEQPLSREATDELIDKVKALGHGHVTPDGLPLASDNNPFMKLAHAAMQMP